MKNKKAYFIIIRGPLGVGKTTIAKKLTKLLKAYYVSMDAVLSKHGLDVYDHYYHTIPRRSYLKANKIILPKAKKHLKKGRIVIFDGCFYYKEQIKHLIKNLKYPYYVFTLKAPLKVCISRDSKRKKVYGKDAAKAVHFLVSRFDYGIVMKTGTQKIEETVNKIVKHWTT